jgi:hypothetical protein
MKDKDLSFWILLELLGTGRKWKERGAFLLYVGKIITAWIQFKRVLHRFMFWKHGTQCGIIERW